ncbi:MAG: hypothetical protein ACPGTI_08860 [bacterium]
MIGKDFIYNSNTIPYTTAQGVAAGWLAFFDWATPEARNSQIPRQDFHGVISSPTFMEGRLIGIDGQIFNTSKTSRGTIRKTIQDIFKFESFPDEDNEFKRLEFTDDDGADWFILCKLRSALEFSHEPGESIISFSGELFAEDPLIRSSALQSVNGNYGRLGGVNLEVNLPLSMNQVINGFTASNDGNIAAPTKVTITAVTDTIVNPKIMNYTTGKFYKVETTLAVGEQLVIDSGLLGEKPSVTKIDAFGTSTAIGASRAAGSNLIYVIPGSNTFVLLGDNFDIDAQTKATAKIEYYHTRQ